MFVQYFGTVERPFAEVDAVLADIASGLDDSADVAYRRGEDLVASIGLGGAAIAKAVHLDVGDALRRENTTSVPLAWTATGTPGLFPTMEADLTITALGSRLTQVAFQGRYKPPLGVVGRVMDKAVLHRFAELSVKDFVDRVIAALSDDPDGVADSRVSQASPTARPAP
jgi:hypothetical protein